MAKYDRRILLPYLRDLYSVELMIRNCQDDYRKLTALLEANEAQLEAEREPEKQNIPSGKSVTTVCVCFVMVCLAAIASLYLIIYSSYFTLLTVFFIMAAGVCLIQVVKSWHRYQEECIQYEEYQDQLREYQKGEENRRSLQAQLQAYKVQMSEILEQSRELASIRHSLYDANVLPIQFRSIYAVQYLFEYFRTSKADDIDTVLQIYAIQEMRVGPEEISEKQAELILHQRVILAKQVMNDAVQRTYVETQMKEIANMEENAEYRTQYLRMIDDNLRVSNYFLQYKLD